MNATAYSADADAVVRACASDPVRGLSAHEAQRRIEADGPNELPAQPVEPLWRRALDQLADPLIGLLLIAIGISVVAWVLEGSDGLPVDALVIAIVIVVNTVLGLVEESRAQASVAALSEMTRATTTLIREGKRIQVPACDIVVGDLLVLAEGDRVSADARLLRADALSVVESALTGEAEAVAKQSAPIDPDAPLAERTNMVYRGTSVARGSALAVVTATGADTEMGAIARLLDSVDEAPTPLQREITRVSKALGIIVGAIAVIIIVVMLIVSGASTLDDIVDALLLGVSLAVAAVPEGLPAILSVVLAMGVRRMAMRRALVKNLTSVEALGSASVICSDKTGTLTRSEMTIQEVVTASGATVVSGIGYAPEGDVGPDADRDHVMDSPVLTGAQRDEVTVVLSGGVLASDAELTTNERGEWIVLGDPTEGAFLVAEKKLGVDGGRDGRFTRQGTIPFTSERKLMSVVEYDAKHQSRSLIVKGAADVLIDRCTHIRVDSDSVPLSAEQRGTMLAEVEQMSARALRTLAVAYRILDAEDPFDQADESLETGLTLAGVVGIIDPPRPEARDAIADAHRAGIRVLMITGDHPATAGRIAADLGIAEQGSRVLTGADLSAMSPAQLQAAVRDVDVYARVAPAHKMSIVHSLQADGCVVAMTGDGVNDAPALRQADIGVAMGIAGTQVTQEAGAMVLADDNFATIVDAVAEGRRIFDNIRKFLRYLLSSNMGEVMMVFAGVALAPALGLVSESGTVIVPLLATQILWINLVTDSAPALAMGVDPATGDLMAQPPRRSSATIIDRRMWGGILLVGVVMAAASLTAIDVFSPGGLIEGSDSLAVARTAGFTTLVFAQLFNTLNSRSDEISALSNLFVNRWLWGAIGFAVVLQVGVVEVPLAQAAFHTAHLNAHHWIVCVALASLVLWVDEARKLAAGLMRRRLSP